MKKFLVLLLVLSLAVSFTSCGKSDAVISVEEKIAGIGTVDKQSRTTIERAENAFAALDAKEQSKVENHDLLNKARDDYDKIISDEVVALIEKIGAVTKDSYDSIYDAELEYGRLTDSQKAKVSNYDVLTNAREQYNTLLITNVENIIDAIQYNGEEPSEDLLEAIEDAEKAYDRLPDDLQGLVKNYDHISTVNEQISEYRFSAAQKAIDSAISSDAGYAEAENLYLALTPEQKKLITNYDTFCEKYEDFKNTPPIEIISYRMSKNSIGNPEIFIKAKNISDKIVKEFDMDIFAFDADGVPLAVDFGDYTTGLNYSKAVKVGEYTSSSSYWTLYRAEYSKIKNVVIILDEVEFFDGTSWENPQHDSLMEKYEQQLLTPGDSNVIPRS